MNLKLPMQCRYMLLISLCAATVGCGQAEIAAPTVSGAEAEAPTKVVLSSPFAGSWYPGDKDQLAGDIQSYMDDAQGELHKDVSALILPHAGYRFSGATAGYGIRQVAGRTFKRVIVMGPTHRYPIQNKACLPTQTHYSTPLGEVPVDRECVEKLMQFGCFTTMPGVHETEHSVQMEIPLLQKALPPFMLVPIVVGQLNEEAVVQVAAALRSIVDADTLVVASSDFTHYGPNYRYEPFADDVESNIRKLDMQALAAIEKQDFRSFRRFCNDTGATICGRDAVAVLLAMSSPQQKVHLLNYDTSGRITADFENSVSYLAVALSGAWQPNAVKASEPPSASGLSKEEHKRLLQIARKTLEFFYEQERAPEIKELEIELTPAMQEDRGVFVTLNKEHRLRGCIGEIFATRPLYQAVMGNVLSSALRDGRFRPVTVDELASIEMEISVLSPPSVAKSYKDIVIGKHGVVLRKGGRTAVFLPQVAPEQGWGVEETLQHLSRKAGLPENAWKEGARFELFEADVFGEDDM